MQQSGSSTRQSPLSRRSVLRGIGLGAVTLIVVADAGLAYRAYDQGVFSGGRGPAFDPWRAWDGLTGPEAVVGAAVLAANAHNSQPWMFAVSADRVDVFADRSRATGANDPLLRELDISLGCAIENMMLTARANGFTPELVTRPQKRSGLVATVHLWPGPVVRDPLFEAIGHRHSNRSEYTGEAVPASTLTDMAALADSDVDPARLQWLTGAIDLRRFAEMLVEATRAHNADDQQSMDSFAWWRGSWDEVQEHRDGLNIDGVGLPPTIRSLGKILPPSDRSAADATFLDRTRLQAGSAAAFGIVVVDNPNRLHDRLAGGRLLQRAHLWAAAHGLGFQHMNQITERIDRDHDLGRSSSFEEPLAALTGSTAVLGAFRIGTPTVAGVASPRRSIEEVLA